MFRQVSFVLAVLAVLAGRYAVTGSCGQTLQGGDPKPAVVLRVTVGDHSPALLKVRVGEGASLDVEGERWLTLSPVLDAGVLELSIREAWLREEDEPLRITIARGEAVLDPLHGLTIEWVGVNEEAGGAEGREGEPCKTCCVTCAGITWCACEVEASCGHCCCQGTCSCEFETGQ